MEGHADLPLANTELLATRDIASRVLPLHPTTEALFFPPFHQHVQLTDWL